MKRNDLIIIAGPTASGKTGISIELAKKTGAEIISGDSMQVYRGMDIGTAKISPDETEGIPHYMIDILDPDEDFNVSVFKEKASQYIRDIQDRNKIPMIVGGTGFYIDALINDTDFTEHADDPEYVTYLNDLADEKGNNCLHELLKDIDPISYEKIHPNNRKRVIRALSYYHLTNSPISEHNQTEKEKTSPYRYCYFVLTKNREDLYKDIDRRVDLMVNNGLLQEVEQLLNKGIKENATSMQAIGYKEMIQYLKGKISFDEAVYIIKRETRHYAKRQLTWFRGRRDSVFINKDEFASKEEILEHMITELKKREII